MTVLIILGQNFNINKSRSSILTIILTFSTIISCGIQYKEYPVNFPSYEETGETYDTLHKINEELLDLIDIMTLENARANPHVKNNYSTREIPVDNFARIRILIRTKPVCQVSNIEKALKRMNGIADSNNSYLSNQLLCYWLPYNKIKKLSTFNDIEKIIPNSYPVWKTR